jgi:hypothetical protein
MGSNPTGGRSAGPALEGQLGPGLDSGGDLGLGLGDLGLGGGSSAIGETPVPLPADVQINPQRRRFQDMMASLFGGGGGFGQSRGGFGSGGGGFGGGFGGGGGSRAK